MIFDEMKKYPVDFAILLVGLASAFAVLVQLAYFPNLQTKVLVLTIAFYFVWGVLHHLLRGSFDLKVALEYASFSVIGLLIGLTILRLF